MSVNDETVRLNKSFEGYHKKLANGDCTVYQTVLGHDKKGNPILDRPTCGYGTTKDVKMGMVWTEAYATQRMMEDLQEAESYVVRYVTVPINENEKGALVLFTNNCGPGNLQKLIVPLNKGDRLGTAKKFPLYNKAQGIVQPGLVSRRAREQSLFLKPIAAPEEPAMPQTVEKSREPLGEKAAATLGTAATIAVQQAAAAATSTPAPTHPATSIPTISDIDKMVTAGQHVRSLTEQAGDLGQWLYHSQAAPFAIAAILIGAFFIWKSAGTGTSGRASSDSSN